MKNITYAEALDYAIKQCDLPEEVKQTLRIFRCKEKTLYKLEKQAQIISKIYEVKFSNQNLIITATFNNLNDAFSFAKTCCSENIIITNLETGEIY